jgi:hypothetical protein
VWKGSSLAGADALLQPGHQAIQDQADGANPNHTNIVLA